MQLMLAIQTLSRKMMLGVRVCVCANIHLIVARVNNDKCFVNKKELKKCIDWDGEEGGNRLKVPQSDETFIFGWRKIDVRSPSLVEFDGCHCTNCCSLFNQPTTMDHDLRCENVRKENYLPVSCLPLNIWRNDMPDIGFVATHRQYICHLPYTYIPNFCGEKMRKKLGR